jgi:hypothetical protein
MRTTRRGFAAPWQSPRRPQETEFAFQKQRAGGVILARRCLFALFVLAVLGGSVAAAGAPITAQYTIRNVATGKCMDIASGSIEAGAAVVQYTCHGGDNQRFRFDYALPGSGPTHISSVNSGMCVIPSQPPSESSLGLAQSPCTAQNGTFLLARAPGQTPAGQRVSFRWTRDPNLCIDVPGAALTDSLVLQMYKCHGGPNQFWDLAR